MAYSKKLMDILGFYYNVLGGDYYAYSTDWSKSIEGGKWLEKNSLNFCGKPFKLDDYLLNMPIYNEKHEPTGKYCKVAAPDLPLLVVSENLKDPSIVVVLPPGIISSLVKSGLSRLAKSEICNELFVFSKEIADYNKLLKDFMSDYTEDTDKTTVPFRIAAGGIYTQSFAYNLDDIIGDSEISPSAEALLPEETIIKHNVIGLLSAIVDSLKEEQPQFVSKGSKDFN